MKRIVALILCLFMLSVTLTACGGSSGSGSTGGGFAGVDHSSNPAGSGPVSDEPAGGGQAATPAPAPAPAATTTPAPAPDAEPVPREGKLGDYHVEIKETGKIELLGWMILYVDFTFINESNASLDDIPLIVTAYQDGAEIESSVNPDQAATRPGDSALLETMYMLNSDESDVTLRLEVRGDSSAGRYEKILRLSEVPEKEFDSDAGQNGGGRTADSALLASMKRAVADADYEVSTSIDYYTDPSVPVPVGGFTVMCDGLKYGLKVLEFAQPGDAVAYAEFVSNRSEGVYSLDVIVLEYGTVSGDNFTEEMEEKLLSVLAAAIREATASSSASSRPGGAEVNSRIKGAIAKAATAAKTAAASGGEAVNWPSSAFPTGFPVYPDGNVVYAESYMADDMMLIIEGSMRSAYDAYRDALERMGWAFDAPDEEGDVAFFSSWLLALAYDEENGVILYIWDSGLDFTGATYGWPENLPFPLPRDADAEVIFVYADEERGSYDLTLADLSQAAADRFRGELTGMGWAKVYEEVAGFENYEMENEQGEWSLLLDFDDGYLSISVYRMGDPVEWDMRWPENLPVQIPAYTDGASVTSTGGADFCYINVEGTSKAAAEGYKQELIGAGWAGHGADTLRKEINQVTWEIYLGYNEALNSLLIRLSRVY